MLNESINKKDEHWNRNKIKASGKCIGKQDIRVNLYVTRIAGNLRWDGENEKEKNKSSSTEMRY